MEYEVDLALWRKVVNIDEYFSIKVIPDKAQIEIYSSDISDISENDKMFFRGVACTIGLLTNHNWNCVQELEENTDHLTFEISD